LAIYLYHVVIVGQRSSCEAGTTLHDLHMSLEEVTRSVKALIDMYCRTFHTEFRFESASIQRGG